MPFGLETSRNHGFQICFESVIFDIAALCDVYRCSLSAEAPGRVPGGRHVRGGQLWPARLGRVLATDHQLRGRSNDPQAETEGG